MGAEAILNAVAWDYFTQDGALTPQALEGLASITEALALDAQQPLALHLQVGFRPYLLCVGLSLSASLVAPISWLQAALCTAPCRNSRHLNPNGLNVLQLVRVRQGHRMCSGPTWLDCNTSRILKTGGATIVSPRQ